MLLPGTAAVMSPGSELCNLPDTEWLFPKVALCEQADYHPDESIFLPKNGSK